MKLTPPSMKRCQALVPDKNWSFMSLGPLIRHRCENIPTTIAKERKKPHGSMSLCDPCVAQCKKQMPRQVTYKKIPRGKGA